MQRFKKEQHSLRQGEPRVCHYRQCPCDKNGKFVYGANGTLTQAARWRIEAIDCIAHIADQSQPQHPDTIALRGRSLLASARDGGCRLPV